MEEVAKIFGDQDEVVVFAEDIQVGTTENELVVKEHHFAAVAESIKDKVDVTKHENVELV